MSNRASIAITLATLASVGIASGGPPTRIVTSFLFLFVVILWLKHDLKPWIEPIVRFLEELLYTDAE